MTLTEQLSELAQLSEAAPSDEWFRRTYQIAAQRGRNKGELWGFKKMVNYAMKYIQGGRSGMAIILADEVREGSTTWKELRKQARALISDRRFMEPGLVPHFVAEMVAERLWHMLYQGKFGKMEKR